MGVDPGLKRVGIAVGDHDTCLASPVRTIERRADMNIADELTKEALNLSADRIVLGLPVRMNGLEGPEARSARKLGALLAKQSGLRVVLWDERLTTAQAERELRAAGRKGTGKRALIDQAAATLLLQSYLDAGAP